MQSPLNMANMQSITTDSSLSSTAIIAGVGGQWRHRWWHYQRGHFRIATQAGPTARPLWRSYYHHPLCHPSPLIPPCVLKPCCLTLPVIQSLALSPCQLSFVRIDQTLSSSPLPLSAIEPSIPGSSPPPPGGASSLLLNLACQHNEGLISMRLPHFSVHCSAG